MVAPWAAQGSEEHHNFELPRGRAAKFHLGAGSLGN